MQVVDAEPTDEESEHIRQAIRRERAGERRQIDINPPHSVSVLVWVVRWVSDRMQLIEWAPELFAQIRIELDELHAGDPDGEVMRSRRDPVPMRVGPFSALLLVGAIDWWLREPGHGEHGHVFLDPVRATLLELLAEDDDVVLRFVARLGPSAA